MLQYLTAKSILFIAIAFNVGSFERKEALNVVKLYWLELGNFDLRL